jgi:hypothetical protein
MSEQWWDVTWSTVIYDILTLLHDESACGAARDAVVHLVF